MTAPVITPLPPAPTRADAPSDFTAKADTFVAAQVGMVTEFNASAAFVNQRAIDADASATAAAEGIEAAIQAAEVATEQAQLATTNGAEQVSLATEQAQRSEDAAEQAQIAAAAAGAAAGLPALAGNGRKFLQVTPDASGVRFGEAEQGIGDVLVTARTPDSSYLQTDQIYLQSAYPELFSIIGLAGGEIGKQWAAVANAPASFVHVATDNAGVWVLVSGIYAHVSNDDGLTWVQKTVSASSNSLAKVATDGNGNWVAVGRFVVATSSDNAETWTTRTASPISDWESVNGLDTDSQGRWLAFVAQSGTVRPFVSTDNGASWARIEVTGFAAAGGFVLSLGSNAWLAADASAGTLKRSSNDGLTWDYIYANAGAAMSAAAKSRSTPGVVVCVGASGKAVRSEDNGLTWTAVDIKFGTASVASISAGPDGLFIATGSNLMARSVDDGKTWALVTGAISGAGSAVAVSDQGTGIAGPTHKRSTPSYPYDTATQFAVPKVQAPLGLKSFIKARLAP